MDFIPIKNNRNQKTPFDTPAAAQRPVSTLLDKFKDNPANQGLILKERPDTPKNEADRWVLC